MTTENSTTPAGVCLLDRELWVPRPVEEVFAFFADARQLETITPPWLHFRVLTPSPLEIRQGTLIDYRLRLHGIPIRWRSEICDWEPPFRFVDQQLRGPYRLWWHEHTFEAREGGTLVGDHVRYRAPGGAFIDRLFVRPDLRRIFDYRHQRLCEIFEVDRPNTATAE